MAATAGAADDGAPRSIEVPEMNTPCFLLFRLPAMRQPPVPADPAPHRNCARPDVDAEPPGACGWFDSSHELVHGLQVQELTTPESLAAVLPLAWWLRLQLEGCASERRA
jgi:hypothetical protein